MNIEPEPVSIGSDASYLGVKFVVTEIKRRVDRFEGLKVYVDTLSLAIVCRNCPTIEHQLVLRLYVCMDPRDIDIHLPLNHHHFIRYILILEIPIRAVIQQEATERTRGRSSMQHF